MPVFVPPVNFDLDVADSQAPAGDDIFVNHSKLRGASSLGTILSGSVSIARKQQQTPCTCLRRCLFPVKPACVLDQGGGAGNGRRKRADPGVPPVLDSLLCRVLGGTTPEMGDGQHPGGLHLLLCAWPTCRRCKCCSER